MLRSFVASVPGALPFALSYALAAGCTPISRSTNEDAATAPDDAAGQDAASASERDAGDAEISADAGDAEITDAGDASTHPEPSVGPFRVDATTFFQYDGSRYRPFFVRGVNVGASRPGRGARDLDVPADTWARWFDAMAAIGFNAIRLYSLQSPTFYRALADYDRAHPDAPLFLIQGTYLLEPQEGASLDLTPLAADFDASVEETVDCVHGRRDIPERSGAAWGTFDADVSAWTLAWLPGREVLGTEVRETDRVHADVTGFEGTRLRVHGTPTEAWMAARVDHHADYELRTYGTTRPIAWSSWLETDPLVHPTEGRASGKDIAQVDLGRVEPFGLPAGYFVSYHVYQYYPDFVSEDPVYRTYSDELGPNSYLGILDALRKHHRGVAVFIAEFGVPSSLGRAHTSFSGMHHGGLDEDAQGRFDARMFRNIHDVGAAGGALFQWTDGWWKRIWITNPLTFPAGRLPLWHDTLNAQQHYGVLAFALPPPDFETAPATTGTARIRDVRASFDAEFVHLRVTLDREIADGEGLVVGVDTIDDARGDTLLPDGTRTSRGSEFVLSITAPDTAELRVLRAYDTFSIRERLPAPGALFRSVPSTTGDFVPMLWRIAAAHGSDDGGYVFPAEDYPIGRLRARRSDAPASSLDSVVIEGPVITIRLPWTLLNFTDPSQRMVMDDVAGTTARETSQTPGIAFAVSTGDDLVETPRRSWTTWSRAPETTERLKSGTHWITEELARLPRFLD